MLPESASMIGDLVDALGWTLLDSLWQAVVVVIGYGVLRGVSTTARARVLVGHCALLVLAILPIINLASHWRAGAAIEVGALPISAGTRWTVEAVAALPIGAHSDWLAWLVIAWSIGVAGLSVRLLREWWMLRRVCRAAQPLDEEWQRRFATLRARLRVASNVGLAMSAQVTAPLLVGVLRPIVLLPAGLVARLPAEQVELILLHELAHLRRLDPWFNLLQAALDTLMFYHPAMHWMSRRLRHDRELCCDDLVVAHGGDRLRYARTLLTLAEHAHAPPLSIALAASGGVLLERVERIVEVDSPRPRARTAVWPVLLLVVAGIAASPVAIQRFVSDAATTLAPLATVAWPTRAQFAPIASSFEVENVGVAATLSRPRLDLAPVAASPDADAAVSSLAATTAVAAPIVAASVPVTFEPAPASPLETDLIATRAETTPATMPTSAAAAPALPSPLRVEMPSYPRGARRDGVEGWVRLAYGIGADGRTGQIEILESQPAGVFDAASVRALERWRFAAQAAGTRRQHQFDFVLRAAVTDADQRALDRCPRRTGSRLCAAVAPSDAASDMSAD
jgi:bla regulator protein BlaR1